MEKLLKNLLNIPWITFVATLVVTALFFWVMSKNTEMETDLDEYMPQDHPAFVYSDQAEEWFGIKDGIIVAVENPDGIYNTATLDTLIRLTRTFQSMEEIHRDDVTSLFTADNITGTELGLDVEPFYRHPPKSEERLNALKLNVED